MKKLDNALQRQMDRNKTKNMLHTNLNQIIETDPDFLTVLEELCAGDGKVLSEPVLQNALSFATRTLLRKLYAINQFLQIDDEKIHDLRMIYLHTWKKIIATKNIYATLKDCHYPALTRWISDLYPEHFVEQLSSTPVVSHVTCEEYSPQLQIDLLRIDLQNLVQPVLDIGCGRSASLVQYLRRLGVEAYGFDRHIEEAESYLQQCDWFYYGFEPHAWGTVISHMAFTNHFIYVDHNDKSQSTLYEQIFDKILTSLSTGGSFYYAPSLPFVERHIEANKYQVKKFAVVKDISMTRVTKTIA